MDQNFELLWNGYTVCPPAWGMRNANESFHRIYYVYGGEAFYQDSGGTRPLEAGHLYILPILHPYTMYHNPSCPLDVLWFHVETPVLLCTQLHDLTIEPGALPFHLLESMRFLANDLDQLSLLRQLFGAFLTLLLQLTQTAHTLARTSRLFWTTSTGIWRRSCGWSGWRPLPGWNAPIFRENSNRFCKFPPINIF